MFRSRFDAALQETLQKDGLEDIDIYEETVEPNRLGGDKHSALFRRYLADKYASRDLDVVVTVWDRALNYALENRAAVFPHAPIVAVVQRSRSLPADIPVAQITTGAQFTDTIRLALTLHPNTRRIAIVDGMLDSNGDVQTEVIEQLKLFMPQVTLEYLRDLPLADLIHRIERLPGDSLILYARQTMRTPTAGMAQGEALKSVAHASRVPVYVVSDQLIGLGAVGGFVLEAESFARLAADTALRVAAGTHVRDIPTQAGPIQPMFDWRQLHKFGVALDKLPAESDIRFREYTFWEQNQRYVISALAVFLVQSGLIVGLLIQHGRRRRAEQALRTNEQELRASHDDARRLAGRIIAAQEVERARIARELHDDISQKVALLAMDIHQVSKGAGLTIARARERDGGPCLRDRHRSPQPVARASPIEAADTRPGAGDAIFLPRLRRPAQTDSRLHARSNAPQRSGRSRALPVPDCSGSAAERGQAQRRHERHCQADRRGRFSPPRGH